MKRRIPLLLTLATVAAMAFIGAYLPWEVTTLAAVAVLCAAIVTSAVSGWPSRRHRAARTEAAPPLLPDGEPLDREWQRRWEMALLGYQVKSAPEVDYGLSKGRKQ